MEKHGIPLGRNMTVKLKKANDTRIQSSEKVQQKNEEWLEN